MLPSNLPYYSSFSRVFTEYPRLWGCIGSEDTAPDKCNRPVLSHFVFSSSDRAQNTLGLRTLLGPVWLL